MLGKPLADARPGPGHDIEDTVGQPGFFKDLGQDQGRGRSKLGWFRNDRVARGQNIRHPLAQDQEREVPGCDDPNDANRFPRHHPEHAIAEIVETVAMERPRQTAGIFVHIGAARNLGARLRDRFPGFERFPIGDLAQPSPDRCAYAQKNPGPFGPVQTRPTTILKRGPRSANSCVQIFERALRDRRHRHVMTRRMAQHRLAVACGDRLTIDKSAKSPRGFGQIQTWAQVVHRVSPDNRKGSAGASPVMYIHRMPGGWVRRTAGSSCGRRAVVMWASRRIVQRPTAAVLRGMASSRQNS